MKTKIMRRASCCEIYKGQDIFCALSKRLLVYSNTGELLAVFSDMKNYSWVCFLSSQKILAMNTAGTFKIYDLCDKVCVSTFSPLNRYMDVTDSAVVDIPNGTLYTLISEVNTLKVCLDYTMKFKVMTLDIQSGEAKFMDIPEGGTATKVLSFEPSSGFHFVFNREMPLGEKNFWLKPVFARFHDGQFFLEDELDINEAKCYFTSEYALLNKDELYCYRSKETVKLNYSCSKKMIYSACVCGDYLIIAFMDRVSIIDLRQNKEVFRYEDEMTCDAKIIGNDLYIGTFKHLLRISNIYSEFTS